MTNNLFTAFIFHKKETTPSCFFAVIYPIGLIIHYQRNETELVGQTFATDSSIKLNDVNLQITEVTFTPLKTEIIAMGDNFKNVIINLSTSEGSNLSAQDGIEKIKVKKFQFQPINSIPQSLTLEVTKGTDSKTLSFQ